MTDQEIQNMILKLLKEYKLYSDCHNHECTQDCCDIFVNSFMYRNGINDEDEERLMILLMYHIDSVKGNKAS